MAPPQPPPHRPDSWVNLEHVGQTNPTAAPPPLAPAPTTAGRPHACSLATCGDVHPNPGPKTPTCHEPLRLISANVSGFLSHWEPIAAWGADVVALQETHLTSASMRHASAQARGAGYASHWGHPVSPRHGAVTAVGVGLLARTHLPCRRAHILSDPQPQGLWSSARWAPFDIPLPGGQQLRIYVAYGMCNQPTRNNDFLKAVFEEAATTMSVPTLILGDFNAGFEAGARASPALDCAVESGRWTLVTYLCLDMPGW